MSGGKVTVSNFVTRALRQYYYYFALRHLIFETYPFLMKELVVATNNAGKLQEIRALLQGVHILSLQDIGFTQVVPEPYDTFEENAHIKAQTVHHFCDKNVLSDDSGLCVPALDNEPGVHSAYYGGEPRSDANNNEKLLAALKDIKNREAYYTDILCLIWNGNTHYFTGVCNGHIATSQSGTGGFGYDPLFVPEGYDESFGVLPAEVKNRISHRAKAMELLQSFIQTQ